MQQIQNALGKEPPSYNNIMLWVACCLAFFGFLRVGEFTIPAKGSYNKSSHLSLSDIAVDKHDNPQLLHITIKQSKTDPFCKGVKVYLGTNVFNCRYYAVLGSPWQSPRPPLCD